MLNSDFTNGVIAVKEKALLGEKLLRFTELTAAEVLHALRESGFGGAEAQDAESLCAAEQSALDGFIREHASTKAERVYLLAPNDFHNAKALCKAAKLGAAAESLLAPEGLISVETLTAAITEKNYAALGEPLATAVKTVMESEAELSGAEFGAVFDRALFQFLAAACKFSPVLKRLVSDRADKTNILTALRSERLEEAEPLFVGGGTLGKKELAKIFDENRERAEAALQGTRYFEFYKSCLAAKEKGLPFTEAERALESLEAEYFFERRYELEGKQPFLYYVFRRRAEIANVRILLVCLNAGLSAQEIKKRLRAI